MTDLAPKREGAAIRVFIADDHRMVRAGLRMVLEDEPDIVVVGEAQDGASALALAPALQPDVVLADISMPPPDGIALACLFRVEQPAIRTIVISLHEDPTIVRDALAAGAAGYLVKRSDPSEVVAAIRRVAAGEIYVDGNLADHVRD